jgi:formylglycine-generating enzyme required for sulfatase activity
VLVVCAMPYCLNPICQQPQNPDNLNFCMSCGSRLTQLLRGKYRIVKGLGQGGFGKTYLAEDEDRCKTICVVKQFAPSPDIASNPMVLEKAIKLFNQEAERLLHLEDHPQIPTLFAYFEEDSYLYLVQQFIKGQTLSEELEQQGIFNESQIRELLNDLLPVLQFIHNRQVIHRDIKPDNIMRRHNDGKLILIDFGAAKQVSNTSKPGTIIGTPGYAPVEQMKGNAFPESDLYSLAVTCIRLMTGIFPAVDGLDALYDPLEGRWLWREKLPNGITINPLLGEILDKLLREVRDRYQSAEDVLAALKELDSPQKGNIKLQSFNFDVITVDAKGKQINKKCHKAEYFSEDLGNGVMLEMVSIPGETFSMGSPKTEQKRCGDESPQHRVTVEPFFMGKYPITQAQWKAVVDLSKVGENLTDDPCKFKGANRPVEGVIWHQAVEFCARLSKVTGKSYRLPSEAEWEYACRAGTTTPFHFGETITPDLANYNGNFTYRSEPKGQYRQETTEVGSFPPNAFGLYDLHGNVLEWCADSWHANYVDAPIDGSVWDTQGNIERLLQVV